MKKKYHKYNCVYYDKNEYRYFYSTFIYFMAKSCFELGKYGAAKAYLDGNRKHIYRIYRDYYIKTEVRKINKIINNALLLLE